MKFEDQEAASGEVVFNAHVRSGQVALGLVIGLATLAWLGVVWAAVADVDEDPIELLFLAGPLTVVALLGIPYARIMGHATVRVSVTSVGIATTHTKINFGGSTEVAVVPGLEPEIRMRKKTIGRGSKRKQVKLYSVKYNGTSLIIALDRKRSAQAFANRLVEALASVQSCGRESGVAARGALDNT